MSDLEAAKHDAGRDAVAILRARLAGNEDEEKAILAAADLPKVIDTLAGTTLEALRSWLQAAEPGQDPDDTLDGYLLGFLQSPDG